MGLFAVLFDNAIRWSKHEHAPRYLAALSFAESSFFPVPPDVMLAPMSLASPRRAWFYAGVTTCASVLGGILGYFLGYYAFATIVVPFINMFSYQQSYHEAMIWFHNWGFWVVFVAGFTPIPYKLFTVTAGVLQLALLPFIFASIIGRGARFFLVAALMRWGGQRFEQQLRACIDLIACLLLALVGISYIIYLRVS